MQYLVSTSGDVVKNEQQTYVVTAKNKQEAIENASNMFTSEYNVIDSSIRASKPKMRTFWGLLSCVLLAFSVFLTFIKWVDGHASFDIRPNLKTGMIAMIFYGIYLVRFKGLNRIMHSKWTDVLSAPLTVAALSCIFNTFLYKNLSIPIFGSSVDGIQLLVLSLILSAFGFKLVSVIVMTITCFSALVNINLLSSAMGPWGFAFIFCGIVGLLLKASVEPSFYSIFPMILNSTKAISNNYKNDLIEARKEINKIGNSIQNRVGLTSSSSLERIEEKGKKENEE